MYSMMANIIRTNNVERRNKRKQQQQQQQQQFRVTPSVYLHQFSLEQKRDERNAMAVLMELDDDDDDDEDVKASDSNNPNSVKQKQDDDDVDDDLHRVVVMHVKQCCPSLFVVDSKNLHKQNHPHYHHQQQQEQQNRDDHHQVTTTTTTTKATTSTATERLHELLHLACSKVVDLVVVALQFPISWTKETARLAMERCSSYYYHVPQHLQQDQDLIYKAIAGGLDPFEMEFSNIRTKNKAFALQAIRSNPPGGFTKCHPKLIHDTDILLEVTSCITSTTSSRQDNNSLPLQLEDMIHHHFGRPVREVLGPFAHHVKTKLDLDSSFYAFLTCITAVAVRSRSEQEQQQQQQQQFSPLQLFQWDEDTSIALNRRIAEFLGVPSRAEMSVLKRSWTTVAQYHDQFHYHHHHHHHHRKSSSVASESEPRPCSRKNGNGKRLGQFKEEENEKKKRSLN